MSLKLWGRKQRKASNILFFFGWFIQSINYQGCCRSIFCFVIVNCITLTMFCFARFIYWPTCNIIVIRYKCFILFQRLHCSKVVKFSEVKLFIFCESTDSHPCNIAATLTSRHSIKNTVILILSPRPCIYETPCIKWCINLPALTSMLLRNRHVETLTAWLWTISEDLWWWCQEESINPSVHWSIIWPISGHATPSVRDKRLSAQRSHIRPASVAVHQC